MVSCLPTRPKAASTSSPGDFTAAIFIAPRQTAPRKSKRDRPSSEFRKRDRKLPGTMARFYFRQRVIGEMTLVAENIQLNPIGQAGHQKFRAAAKRNGLRAAENPGVEESWKTFVMRERLRQLQGFIMETAIRSHAKSAKAAKGTKNLNPWARDAIHLPGATAQPMALFSLAAFCALGVRPTMESKFIETKAPF